MNLFSSDCCGQTRRDFLKTSAGLAAASAVGTVPIIGRAAAAAAEVRNARHDALQIAERGAAQGALLPLRPSAAHQGGQQLAHHRQEDRPLSQRRSATRWCARFSSACTRRNTPRRCMKQVEHDSGKAGFGDSSHRALRRAGHRQVRVRPHRPALHAPLRRRLGGRRGVWRADLLRPRRGGLQRKAGSSRQRLLVSGEARERGLPDARRQTARAGAARQRPRGAGHRDGETHGQSEGPARHRRRRTFRRPKGAGAQSAWPTCSRRSASRTPTKR